MEFREMRRRKQLLSKEDTDAILYNGKTGILAVNGEGGYPYTVPVNYIYTDGAIYFHGAKAGHKFDALQKDSKASFCVIDKDDIVGEELTTYFRSAVAFGKVSMIEDNEEKYNALLKFGLKYYDSVERVDREIKTDTAVCCYKFSIDHLTGKEAIELVRMRK